MKIEYWLDLDGDSQRLLVQFDEPPETVAHNRHLLSVQAYKLGATIRVVQTKL